MLPGLEKSGFTSTETEGKASNPRLHKHEAIRCDNDRQQSCRKNVVFEISFLKFQPDPRHLPEKSHSTPVLGRSSSLNTVVSGSERCKRQSGGVPMKR